MFASWYLKFWGYSGYPGAPYGTPLPLPLHTIHIISSQTHLQTPLFLFFSQICIRKTKVCIKHDPQVIVRRETRRQKFRNAWKKILIHCVKDRSFPKKVVEAFERKSPQTFSNDYPVSS